MSYSKPIERIAIVGTGVIGASWAAQYLRAASTWSRPTPPPTPKPICASTWTRRGGTRRNWPFAGGNA